MPVPQKVWIVDDEPEIRQIFRRALSDSYAIEELKNGLEAINRLKSESPALVILDVKMPQLDGWETLMGLRRRGYDRPVLMITTHNDVESRVRGLEAGADDYLGKPCSPMELRARVKALLRRVPRSATAIPPLVLGEITIDLSNRVASKSGEPLHLTRTDYSVLALLNEHAGGVVSRQMILERAWPDGSGNDHSLDTHIWRLRKKLGDDSKDPRWIKSVPAMGYLLTL